MKVKIQLGKPHLVKHQSLAHDTLRRKQTDSKAHEVQQAVEWCMLNGKRGWAAVNSGLFPSIKCCRTINKRLDGEVIEGEQKRYCSILTSDEEKSLVRYIKNRSRNLQGLTQPQIEVVVLNILRCREQLNKKGGRKFIALSKNATAALRKEKVGRAFFNRIRTTYPELKKKVPKKVDINRGFNVTRSMATEYLDDLASEINYAGIGQLEKVEPGVWHGHIDTTRIICHDETPQFINHGDSSYTTTKVFGVAGQPCETLTKSNRECVTVHPFSNLQGETLCTQVIFSGAGLTSQMAPEATEKMQNLLATVNQSGVSDHKTLLAAYKELDRVLVEKQVIRPIIVIADGHSSRFDEQVLLFLQASSMLLFILHPDTSGGTQLHDQINARLHSLYDEKKAELYTTISTLNRESFMNILSEAWEEFADPQLLRKAAKRVGLSDIGLNINWMNQEMFQRADNLHNPITPTKSSSSAINISSPVGIRKNSIEWYKHKLDASMEIIKDFQNTPIVIDDVEGLLPLKKIQPTKSKTIRITQEHGSMRAKDMLTKVHERNVIEKAKETKKADDAAKKDKLKEAFLKCRESCSCSTSKCVMSGMKQCSNCFDVLKSQCSKSACTVDGQRPSMVTISSRKVQTNTGKQKLKKLMIASESEEELSEELEESEEESEEEMEDGLEDEEEISPVAYGLSRIRSELSEVHEASNQMNSDEPMDYNDVFPGMWVVVIYEGEKFIGNVQHKKNGEFNVLCLEKPFGIRVPQSYESGEPIYYDKVYHTNIVPTNTQIDSSGKKQRKWFFTY